MSGDLKHLISKLKIGADSPNWHKREESGFTLRNLMEDNFDEVYNQLKFWCTDKSENIRRAACLACMQRKGKTDSSRVLKILKYLDILMKDDSIYVRKCCGPFVVGYLGYTYPTITIPWLKRKTRLKNEFVRINIAKAFSQALGKTHPEEGLDILNLLGFDDRSRVQSAIRSSIKNILRHHPNLAFRYKSITYSLTNIQRSG